MRSFTVADMPSRTPMQPDLAGSLSERASTFQATHFHEVEGLSGDIRFATARCSLGALLVARTEDGLCAVFLGDDTLALISTLGRRFPQAQVRAGGTDLAPEVAAIQHIVEESAGAIRTPLVLCGTPFQRRVWRTLSAVPTGTTATYGDIARAVKRPSAVRAVATACGSNALAVIIPCHRIVRKDGQLSGYRWGTARKQALLERERRHAFSIRPCSTDTMT